MMYLPCKKSKFLHLHSHLDNWNYLILPITILQATYRINETKPMPKLHWDLIVPVTQRNSSNNISMIGNLMMQVINLSIPPTFSDIYKDTTVKTFSNFYHFQWNFEWMQLFQEYLSTEIFFFFFSQLHDFILFSLYLIATNILWPILFIVFYIELPLN